MPHGNIPTFADGTMNVAHSTPLDIEGSRVEGLSSVPFDKGLLQGTGTLESPVIEAAFPFDDLVGSWIAATPPDSWVQMEAQVRQGGRWSKWFKLSRWEPGGPRSFFRQADRSGFVDVDTLRLERKAGAFRYRIVMESAGARDARLLRVSVAYQDSSAPPAARAPFRRGPWVRELKVPARSQMEEQERYKRDICSPTALAMVLAYWGIAKSTLEVLESVRDHGAGIYGNWTLNVAAAGCWGLSGQVARLGSMERLQDEIGAGRPVVVSLAYAPGQLAGSPIRKTKGHLVVAAGFTPKGDVIVMDPAAKTRKGVRRVFRRRQFERAWLDRKRGLAYVLGPRFPEEAVTGLAAADLRARPRRSRRSSPMDPARLSQLLYGERVRILEARGDWVRVEALEQPSRSPDGRWRGYPGWVRAGALRQSASPYAPNSVVRAKRAELRWTEAQGLEETITLPLGAALESDSGPGPDHKVRLLEGRLAKVHWGGLFFHNGRAPAAVNRRDLVETAALFLGDSYVWGGRSSYQPRPGWGVDCSGLVQLAYRSVGMLIPRDAQDQYLRARPVKRRGLQVGDLVFLSENARARKIDHVLLYAGGDGLIESCKQAGRTLRTTFTERFALPLKDIESGQIVVDRSGRKPLHRRIHFATFLRNA